MLDVLIRIPNGSVKTNGSCFVLPVVATESWDAVAVLSCTCEHTFTWTYVPKIALGTNTKQEYVTVGL